MSEIDERIVRMEFDNKNFETNVGNSISSLEKLQSSLDMKNASDGFERIDSSARKIDFSSLTNAVGSVAEKFSALKVMGITALANITNSAVNAGKRILNSLTIEPISTGFDEYELKMGSIQTIMASTGESIDTVNKYLKELNLYSDKTIYSFADMTNNIGKFTNAGVKLEDAVAAIKGVSNVAAVSGANTNEASRAMYNFAQALSAGYVKLIDWKSIENANMATVEFKDQLIQTGLALGTITETADGMYKTLKGNVFNATSNFNEVLQDQWMTSEVLVTTLKNYADETTEIGKKAYSAAQDVKTFTQLMDTLKEAAQSGWSETWELIVGDINEAKAVFGELSEIIGGIISDSADARNNLLGGALNSKWDEFTKSASEAEISVDTLKEKIIEVGKKYGEPIDKMIEDNGSFEESLKEGWLTADIVSEAINNMADETDNASRKSKEAADNFISLKESFSSSIYDMNAVMNQFIAAMSSSNSETVAAFDALGIATTEDTGTIKENLDSQVDAYQRSLDKQLEAEKSKRDEAVEAYKQAQEDAEEILEKGLEAEMDNLEKSLDAEMDAFESAHDTKLKLIDEEYTEKLKLLDEDKYNQIKAIEDEIKALDAKTDAENKAAKESENAKKRLELQKKVNEATDFESRQKAQEALDEFDKKLTQEKVVEERKQRKEELNEKKKSINEQYKLDKQNLQDSKQAKKDAENEQYNTEKKLLKESHDQQKKDLKEIHDQRKKDMKDENETRLKNLKAEKDAEIDAIKETNDISLKSYKNTIAAQKKALEDMPVMRDSNVVFQETIAALDKIENQEEKARLTAAIFGDTLGNIGDTADIDTAKMRAFAGQIKAAKTPMNDLIGAMSQPSGRDLLIDAVKNILLSIIDIAQTVKSAWNEVIPSFDSDKLYNIIKAFDDFTVKLKAFTGTLNDTDGKSSAFKSTLKGLFAILDIVWQLFTSVFDALKPLVSILFDAGDAVLGVSGSFGDWLVSLDKSIRETDLFGKIIGKIVDFVTSFSDNVKTVFNSVSEYAKPVTDKIVGFVDKIKGAFGSFGKGDVSGFADFIDGIKTKLDPISDLGSRFKDIMSKIANAMKTIAHIFISVGTILKNIFSKIAESFKDDIGNIDISKVTDLVNSISLAVTAGSFKSFTKNLSGSLATVTTIFSGFIAKLKAHSKPITGIVDGIKQIMNGLKGTLEAYQNDLKARTLLKIAEAIAILSVSMLILGSLDPDELGSATAGMTAMLAELMGSMAIFTKIAGGKGIVSIGKLTGTMIALSASVLILTIAVKSLAELDSNELTQSLFGIGILMGELVIAAKQLSKSSGKLMKGAGSLILFAVAILVLTKSVEKLGQIDTNELIKGLVGVGVLMGELVAFLKILDGNKMSVGTGVGILVLSAAILVMAQAVKSFSELDTAAMIQGLIGVGVVLGELAAFLKLTGDSKKVMSTAIGLTILGAAMLIFASAVEKIGSIPLDQLIIGLSGMAVTLAMVVAAIKLLPKNTIAIGAGLVVVAAAMKIMASALTDMGQMSWEELAVGLIALAGSLVIIGIAVNAMTSALSGAAAIFVVAAAIAILAPALKSLGDMSWESIGKGLLALAAALAIFGAAALILGPIVPTMLALGGAVALLGIGFLACGVGVLALAAGLTALAAAGAGAAGAIVLIVTALYGLIPVIAKALAEGLVAFIAIIGESGPALCDALAKLIIALCDALIISLPPLFDTLRVALDELLALLLDYIPILADWLIQLFIQLGIVLKDNLFMIVDLVVDIVTTFIDSLAAQTKQIIDCVCNLVIVVVNGLADSIRENTPLLVEAIENLIDALIGAGLAVLEGSVDIFKNAGQKIMNSGLVQGIKSKFEALKNCVKQIPTMITDGIKNGISKAKEVGSNIITGLTDGIKDGINTIKDTASNLGESALNGIKDILGIHSPSREFAKIGEFADKGLVQGLKKYSPYIDRQVTDIGKSTTDSLSKSFANISDSINDNIDNQPTIRPVLDLSNINEGAKTIDTMMSRNYAMTVGKDIEESRSLRFNTPDNQNGAAGNNNSGSFIFNQYNTSPKALSRREIYHDSVQGVQLANAMR